MQGRALSLKASSLREPFASMGAKAPGLDTRSPKLVRQQRLLSKLVPRRQQKGVTEGGEFHKAFLVS